MYMEHLCIYEYFVYIQFINCLLLCFKLGQVHWPEEGGALVGAAWRSSGAPLENLGSAKRCETLWRYPVIYIFIQS